MGGQVKVTNNSVFVIRDKTETETTTKLFIPDKGREKPNIGIVYGVGGLVKDPEIKRSKGKKALFHKGTGQEIDYEGQTYLILDAGHIIGIV